MQTRKTELRRGYGQNGHGRCAGEVRQRSSKPLLTNHDSINRDRSFQLLESSLP